MNRPKRVVTAALAASMIAVVPLASAVSSESEIGVARQVETAAYGIVPASEAEQIHTNDGIYTNQRIETTRKGAIRLQFLDETELWVGASSEVVLDKFLFDPNAGTGAFAANIAEGIIRMVTGDMAGGDITLNTPIATIGVRGTDFVLRVAASGAISAIVYEGTICITPNDGSQTVCISEDETAKLDLAVADDVLVDSIEPFGSAPETLAGLNGGGLFGAGGGGGGGSGSGSSGSGGGASGGAAAGGGGAAGPGGGTSGAGGG
jgi:hypothetical protein